MSLLFISLFRAYTDSDELKRKVDAFMMAFDKAEAEARRKSKKTEVDDDGFTLVKPSMVGNPNEVVSRKRKSSEGVSDFYRFQLKDRKIAEWSEEKRQEVRDKTKMNEMKSSGKFQL